MKENEVVNVLQAIVIYYPNFKIADLEEMTTAWHLILRDFDYQTVMKNLERHVRTEKFPPTIADLIPEKRDRAIPNVEETKMLLQTQFSSSRLNLPANPEVVKRAKEEARRLLGLEGGQSHE